METTIQIGSSGKSVRFAQQMLQASGFYKGEISETFDDQVTSAVQAFQTANGLPSDGIITPTVWDILRKNPREFKMQKPIHIEPIKNIPTESTTKGPHMPNNPKVIPAVSPPVKYAVVYGDSLWKIAQKFGTTVDLIKRANGLTANSLSIGQILIMPDK